MVWVDYLYGWDIPPIGMSQSSSDQQACQNCNSSFLDEPSQMSLCDAYLTLSLQQ